jgi:flagellar basal body-associated protein FliL
MKSSVKRTICIAIVVVVAVCAALAAHFFPGRSAGDIPDIVKASADENGMAYFGCKSDNDYNIVTNKNASRAYWGRGFEPSKRKPPQT